MPGGKKRQGSDTESDAKRPKIENGKTAGGAASLLEKYRQRKAELAAQKGQNATEDRPAGATQDSKDVANTHKPTEKPTNGRGNAASMLEKLRQRKAALQAQNQRNEEPKRDERESSVNRDSREESPRSGMGLNVPLHPLLSGQATPATTPPTGPTNRTGRQPASNPYFDPEAAAAAAAEERRRNRGLVFNQQGKYIRQAEELRRQAELAQQAAEREAERQRRSGIDNNANERLFKRENPPAIEWWDEPIALGGEYGAVDPSTDAITEYIQHPIPVPPPWEKLLPAEQRVYLTKREIKRRRKNERFEKRKEKQDRIRLGLDPAPPPKIKPSNVMSVYATEAIRDPTLMEMKAREEVAKRRAAHEAENEARKLTPEQRYLKEQDKIEKQKEKGLFCAVFRIENLSDRKHQFLVNYNALQSKFTGVTIFGEPFTLVIVEGGAREIAHYQKLLLQRVKWTENAPPRDVDPENPPPPPPDLSKNRCRLVWHGQLRRNKFNKWTRHRAETEQDAKDLLARHGADSYWVEARQLHDDL